jgi:hypothetical protein
MPAICPTTFIIVHFCYRNYCLQSPISKLLLSNLISNTIKYFSFFFSFTNEELNSRQLWVLMYSQRYGGGFLSSAILVIAVLSKFRELITHWRSFVSKKNGNLNLVDRILTLLAICHFIFDNEKEHAQIQSKVVVCPVTGSWITGNHKKLLSSKASYCGFNGRRHRLSCFRLDLSIGNTVSSVTLLKTKLLSTCAAYTSWVLTRI